jgi:NaMN:DMB phosphoribosyltransferase
VRLQEVEKATVTVPKSRKRIHTIARRTVAQLETADVSGLTRDERRLVEAGVGFMGAIVTATSSRVAKRLERPKPDAPLDPKSVLETLARFAR